jgi:hypothetical protein
MERKALSDRAALDVRLVWTGNANCLVVKAVSSRTSANRAALMRVSYSLICCC